MARDDELQAIAEIGRRTRAPVPRSLWIAAAIVGGICTTGLAVALLGNPAPAPGQAQTQAQINERSQETGGGDPASSAGGAGGRAPRGIERRLGPGWGSGLAIGAAGGLVIGFALGRHRRDHSSRKRP